MAAVKSKIGATITMESGKTYTVFEGNVLKGVTYKYNGGTKTINGCLRVINAATTTNNTIPDDCPPKPFVHQYVSVQSLTIDGSGIYSAEMTRVRLSDIIDIAEVYNSPDDDPNLPDGYDDFEIPLVPDADELTDTAETGDLVLDDLTND